VAIARALQGQDGKSDGVLVLDEPTASLPANEVEHLLRALRRYADAGQAIVFVTHRLAEACEIADSATVLRNGRVLANLERDQITRERLTELIAGEIPAVEETRQTLVAGNASRALEVRALSGGAVVDCTFDLHEGEILGLSGLLGAGCTTLLQLLFGLVPRESGEAKLTGYPRSFDSPRAAMSAGVAYVPSDRKRDGLFADLSVSENLSAAVITRYWRSGRLRLRLERADSRAIITQQNIKAESERALVSTLSGGNQQKVMLARWLRREPRILLLDEPTQGVDVAARGIIHRLIRDAVASGVGAIVASSDEDELAALCDRVLVLRRGRVSAILTGADVTPERIAMTAHADPTVR
jgi:ribose transport system ATP-binding protein